MNEQLDKVIAGKDLSFDEAYQVMMTMMAGEASNAQIKDYLLALKSKGEHFEEIAGSAKAMRDMSVKIESNPKDIVIDVCGTGGDESGSFNISTAAAIVVAGAGIKVAKHGNRSISSKSGSADVLAELGVNISLTPQKSERALAEVGITFLFAPDYHPAMKHVAPVRRELATKTIFNMLGPLTNPAGVRCQMIGTFNEQAAEKMAKALAYLDMDKVCLVCSENRFDEITLTAPVKIFEYSPTETKEYMLDFASLGYPRIKMSEIAGDSPVNNANLLRELFSSGMKDAKFYVTCANAALGLYCAGYSDSLDVCINAAEDSLQSGRAKQKLDELVEFGQ